MPLDISGSNTAANDIAAEWMRKYRQQKRLCEEANGVLRNVVKRAKADGVNTKAMIETVKATKLDPEDVARDLKDQMRYMQIVRIPITAEDLLAGWDAEVSSRQQREDDLWDADDKGYRAGRAGADISEMPYDDPEMEQHWRDAWHKGQAAIARELGPDTKQGDASKQRPARDQPALGDLGAAPADPPYVPGSAKPPRAPAVKPVVKRPRKSAAKRSAAH